MKHVQYATLWVKAQVALASISGASVNCGSLFKSLELVKLSSITTDIALDNLNTFDVTATASNFLRIDHIEQLDSHAEEIAAFPERFILGAGSNLLFVGDYDGLVIYPQLKGIQVVREDQKQVILRVAASENWHELVIYCLKQGFFGLENLALIPGTVGASPVQNIGAYGVEVESFIQRVQCYDLKQQKMYWLSHADCQFAYRDSFIKRAGQGRYLVTNVEFRLSKTSNLVLTYKPLREYFASFEQVTAQQVFDRVCQVRTQKLPDPKLLANAGSFFKNPVIGEKHYQNLINLFPQLVAYPIKSEPETRYKIAAGWLIEKAGFKGKSFGKVGVHKEQALVLVNYSDDDGNNILLLAEKIIESIWKMFSIKLEPEVRIIGQ